MKSQNTIDRYCFSFFGSFSKACTTVPLQPCHWSSLAYSAISLLPLPPRIFKNHNAIFHFIVIHLFFLFLFLLLFFFFLFLQITPEFALVDRLFLSYWQNNNSSYIALRSYGSARTLQFQIHLFTTTPTIYMDR